MQPMGRNWSERHLGADELIGILYETVPRHAHLDVCLYCQGRLQAMSERRATDADWAEREASVSARELAAQRSRIYAKLDTAPTSRPAGIKLWLWAGAPLAAVAALLLTVGIPTSKPVSEAKTEPTAAVAVQDTLYTDIYQSLSQETPAGVSAVAGMFETVSFDSGTTKN